MYHVTHPSRRACSYRTCLVCLRMAVQSHVPRSAVAIAGVVAHGHCDGWRLRSVRLENARDVRASISTAWSHSSRRLLFPRGERPHSVSLCPTRIHSSARMCRNDPACRVPPMYDLPAVCAALTHCVSCRHTCLPRHDACLVRHRSSGQHARSDLFAGDSGVHASTTTRAHGPGPSDGAGGDGSHGRDGGPVRTGHLPGTCV